jgi:hypothetical protein
MRYVVLSYRDRVVEPTVRFRGPEWETPVATGVTVDQALERTDEFLLVLGSSGTGISRHSVLERIEIGDGRVSLRYARPTPGGTYAYVSADHEWVGPDPNVRRLGVAVAGRVFMKPMEAPGEAEVFLEIPFGADHTFALETYKELFVTAEGGGKGAPLTINRNEIGEWQLFHYLAPPEGFLPKVAPTVGEQAIGSVKEAQTEVSGIPANPLGTVQGAETEMQRPAGLRDAIFRRRDK